jgi:muramidase (phage lysozyme)
MRATEKALATLGALGLLLWLYRSRETFTGGSMEIRFSSSGVDEPPPELPEDLPAGEPGNYWGGDFMGPGTNVAAFLHMIRRAEHRAADVSAGMDYHTYYGGSRFNDLTDHPAITGEKAGVPLRADQCRAAGFPNGRCVSTAAGAYQFTKPTWQMLRAGPPRLPSFSPEDQDLAAVRLLDRIGALALIESGDIPGAVALASIKWASLPGSTAGQNPKGMDEILAYFSEGGGTVT